MHCLSQLPVGSSLMKRNTEIVGVKNEKTKLG